MIRFAENLNKMIAAGLGGPLDPPRTEVAVGHRVVYTEASGAVVNFETNVIAPVKNLRVTMEPIQEGTGDPSPDNIRPISGRESVAVWRDASYNPSADPALTIQLGDTVYGGTLDVTTGVLTVNKGYKAITWGEMETRETSDDTISKRVSLGFSPITGMANNISNVAPYNTNANFFPRFVTNVNGYAYMVLPKDADDSILVQIVSKLATPLTIQLTAQQMTTLKGQNNVWSDADSVALEYPTFEYTEGY